MKLNGKQSKEIYGIIDHLFWTLKAKFLGRFFKGPKIYFEVVEDTNPLFTLEGLFHFSTYMVLGPGHKVDKKRVKTLNETAGNYIDAERLKTRSKIIEGIERSETLGDLEENLEDQMKKTTNYINLLVGSEARAAQSVAESDGIAKVAASLGVSDPTICKRGVIDDRLSEQCAKLWHTPSNLHKPVVYKLSELKAGYNTDQKNPVPTVGLTHINCFVDSTIIYTDKGPKTIKDLYESKKPFNTLSDLRIGEGYESYRKRGVEYLPCTPVYETGEREVFRVKTRTSILEVSGDHLVWVKVPNKPQKQIKVKDLTLDDKILTVSDMTTFGTDHWPEEAELIGSVYGDGCLTDKENKPKTSMMLSFFGEEEGDEIKYGRELEHSLRKIFTNKHKPITELTKFIYSDPEKGYSKLPQIRFSSRDLFRFAESKGFVSKKRILTGLWGADITTVAAFFRGLYAADGTINMLKYGGSVSLGTVIESFAYDISQLLTMFGISAKVYKTKGQSSKMIKGRVIKQCDIYRVMISGKQVDIFAEFIGMGIKYKNDRLLELMKKPRKTTFHLSRVMSIESIGIKPTYCFTQPKNNTTIANGLVVGQCRHIMSFVPPNFGFSQEGTLTFKGFGYDEFESQRNKK